MSSRCSGAIALATAIGGVRPVDEHDPATGRERRLGLGPARRVGEQRLERASATASATASTHVISTAAPPGPCSACASRSAATSSGSTVVVGDDATSDGPA